jgi:peptidoglycan/LPS O-acetylase OafA/YrhL
MSINPKLHRGDILGLRGLSVLAVIVFHAKQGYASGGFSGVDIFFTLSGFLIAQSIQANVNKDG